MGRKEKRDPKLGRLRKKNFIYLTMLFNSFDFVWMFPMVFAFYYGIVFLVRHKRRDRKIENTAL